MPKKIADQFTGLLKRDGTPMSRQQVHMLRKKMKGLCQVCGEPAIGVHCVEHAAKAREKARRRIRSRRRYWNADSYRAAVKELQHAA